MLIAENHAENPKKASVFGDLGNIGNINQTPLRLRGWGGSLKARGGGRVHLGLPSLPFVDPPLQNLAMVLPTLSALLLLPLLALAHPAPHPDGPVKGALPGKWYHDPGHPVERLFRRQGGNVPTDGVAYPQVGSAQWAAGFPGQYPDVTKLPPEWVAALNASVAAGNIPNIPVATNPGGGANPVYPQGTNPAGPVVCSGTDQCRNPDDIWDAPSGVLAVGFDDGPSDVSAHVTPIR